uniref:Uncharacterized protein n=1 Tax=Anguilla anguilla TaxID=7936 RepID=A0A0E9WAM6_ANGAN
MSFSCNNWTLCYSVNTLHYICFRCTQQRQT